MFGGRTATVAGEDPPCERRARGVALVGALCICKSQLLLEVSEEAVAEYAGLHDAGLWECLSS